MRRIYTDRTTGKYSGTAYVTMNLRDYRKLLAAENEALRKDQLESLQSGRRTAANWIAFLMDNRVKWERSTESENG